jgi:5-methylthioadenosine/S-adenosylhomocysteine deaminase
VVHCPTSNLKLASGLCPIAALSAKKVNVALGTDSTASNNGLDMFSELKTAAIVAKQVAGDPTVIPAHEALRMATINGARALGLERVTGSLEKGKSADIISIHIDSLESVPMFSVISHLVYVSSREHVEDVWVAGERVMKSRRLLTLDEAGIKARARTWQARMTAERTAKIGPPDTEMEGEDNGSTATGSNGKKRSATEAKADEQQAANKPKTDE